MSRSRASLDSQSWKLLSQRILLGMSINTASMPSSGDCEATSLPVFDPVPLFVSSSLKVGEIQVNPVVESYLHMRQELRHSSFSCSIQYWYPQVKVRFIQWVRTFSLAANIHFSKSSSDLQEYRSACTSRQFSWLLLLSLVPRKMWNVSQGHIHVAKVLLVLPLWYAIFQVFGKSWPTVGQASVVKRQMVLHTVIDGTQTYRWWNGTRDTVSRQLLKMAIQIPSKRRLIYWYWIYFLPVWCIR